MSRTPLPYSAGDIAALARSLRAQLAGRSEPPGHVEWLNMLAKAAGWRNFQHFRTQAAAEATKEAAKEAGAEAMRERAGAIAEPAPPPAPPAAPQADPPAEVDPARILRIARCFDGTGALARWPSRLSDQRPCLWVLWSRLAAGRVFTEEEVNRFLRENHRFGDHALLRRDLCDLGLVTRTPDGREYRRVERPPPADALALIRHLKAPPPAGALVSRSG